MKFVNGVTDYEEYIKDRKENNRFLSKKAIVNYYLAKQAKGEELTFADQIHLVSCVNVSTLTGKMEGFHSVSTSCMMNQTCQARAKIPGSICADCYAAAGLNRYSSLCQALEINHIVVNNFLISEEAWATLPIPSTNGYSRIESHGDTASVTAARNYLRILKSHLFLVFGVWTHNLNHYRAAFHLEGGKPVNMKFIYSSLHVNEVDEVPDDMLEYVDHVFTVVTPEYATEMKIKINCGKYEGITMIDHKCRNCMHCYINGPYHIYELKK